MLKTKKKKNKKNTPKIKQTFNIMTKEIESSLNLQGLEWAFRKSYRTKVPGMVQGGLLAPQNLK